MIQEQLAARTARRDHRHLAVGLIRLRMSHRDNSLDGAIAFKQRAAECDRLGADRHAANRRAEVNAGPDTSIGATYCCRHRVPERPIVVRQHLVGGGNQCVIGCLERQWEGAPPTQRPRPPLPCLRSPAWRWRPRRIVRAPCARSRRRRPCGRAGIAWRSPGLGQSAGCRS
jgi:hypothetical protein